MSMRNSMATIIKIKCKDRNIIIPLDISDEDWLKLKEKVEGGYFTKK